MELNIETKQQLEKLLAKPALVTQEHIPLLQNLVKAYPYYQLLHLLLAKASSGSEHQQQTFTKAALYNNGNVLHRIINEPKQLKAIEEINVITYQPWVNTLKVDIVTETAEIDEMTTIVEDAPNIENLEPLQHEIIDADNAEITENIEKVKEAEIVSTEEEQPEKDVFVPEIENLEPLPYEVIAEELPKEEFQEAEIASTEEEQPEKDIFVPEIENLEPLPYEVITEEQPKTVEIVEEAETITIKAHQPIDKNFIVPEIENLEPLQSEVIKVCEPKTIAEKNLPTEETDEQETFEEIGEVVVPSNFTIQDPEKDTEEETILSTEANKEETPESTTQEDISLHEIELVQEKSEVLKEVPKAETLLNTTDETSDNDLVIESIASTDFFAFDKNFSTETISEEDHHQEEIKPLETSTYKKAENIVSKYDDDKLPFTFLWWLAKTRKDHEQIFKPFVSPVKPVVPTTDLQQQYVEHIFHIQSPLETNIALEQVNSDQKTLSKENKLIENFIKNEPQMKVPKPDQINNENKAKKSSEDNYDLVSETLAEIYIEQMLYHKAIDTYQKLSLKFPEKSRYFADLIESLEKKI